MSVEGLPPRTVDECLWWLPAILRRPDATTWERTFAASMLAKGRRRNWTPTPKELAALRRLVEAHLEPVEVIDAA